MLYRGSDLFGFYGAKLGNGGSTISANYNIALADAGLLLVHDGSDNVQRTFTIPANGSIAIPQWTQINIYNEGDSNTQSLLIAITTDTLTLANSTTTGTRTIAANCPATLLKYTSTKWVIWGMGVT